jgi:CRISPR-associated protein Cas2
MKLEKYIIAYDIRCKKRLAKVHRLLKSQAIFLQSSVYYWQGTPSEIAQLQQALVQRINKETDDIRGYKLTQTQALHFFARPALLNESYCDNYPIHKHHPQSPILHWGDLHEII